MTLPALRRYPIFFSLLFLASFIFITFYPVLQNDFVTWDDGLLITENPIIQEFSLQSVHRAFTSYDPELYIPLTFLSYQLDHLLWGFNPVGFHLTNLVLHTLNAVLVFILVNFLMKRFQKDANSQFSILPFEGLSPSGPNGNSQFAAFAVAILFALHPINTEAIAWASARKDLLSGFFFLLTLCAYLKWRECVMVRDSPVTQYWYCGSLFSFLLGLLAKVSIAPLPLVLLLIEWFLPSHPLPSKGEGRVRVLKRVSPYFLLSIIFGIIALGGKHGNTELLSEKILIGAKATAFYLGRLVWPTGLSVLYPYTRPITWSNPDLLLPLILVILLSTLAFLFRKKCPMVAYGWSFFLLMLLPSFTNFAKGHDLLRDVYFASDRYAYLPSIGIFFLLGTNLFSLLSHLSPAAYSLLISVFLLPLPFFSYRQSHVWHNTETLFQNVTRHYPTSHIAWNNLGSIALERGDTKTAMEDYERSLLIRPNAAAFFNLGQIALKKGLTKEAMELYRRAITSRPNDTDSLLNLGVLYLRIGNAAAAADLFHRAVVFNDRLAIAHFNLGLALEAQKDPDGARSAYARALGLDPNDQEAREKLARLATRK